MLFQSSSDKSKKSKNSSKNNSNNNSKNKAADKTGKADQDTIRVSRKSEEKKVAASTVASEIVDEPTIIVPPVKPPVELPPQATEEGTTANGEEDVKTSEKMPSTEVADAATAETAAPQEEAEPRSSDPENQEQQTSALSDEDENTEKAEDEKEYSAAEGTDASLLSEFAPKPMNIPNIDLEKEKRRQEKRSQNRKKQTKKVEARKKRSRKKASVGRKILVGLTSFLLFLVLSVTMTGLISVLSVQLATSKSAVRYSVKNMNIASEVAVGSVDDSGGYLEGIVDTSKISDRTALVDIIRDNAQGSITYGQIISTFRSSSVETMVADKVKAAADYLLMGKKYVDPTGQEIAALIRENSTHIRSLTGRSLTEEDYTRIAAHYDNDASLGDISAYSLSQTKLGGYTHITRHIFSVKILAALLLINILLIILLCILTKKTAHIPVGWAFIVSGILVVVGAVFYRPLNMLNSVSSLFAQTVINNYCSFFTTATIIVGGVFAVIGAFIFLVGNASSGYEDEE